MNDKKINDCNYDYLEKLVVKYILNQPGDDDWDHFNEDKLTVIDNGDYQGTMLFMIPRKRYQPSEYDYLITYAGYGSCSYCDTLLSIQSCGDELLPTEKQVNDYMILCKDLVCNIVKPYNSGWREDEDFDEVKELEMTTDRSNNG